MIVNPEIFEDRKKLKFEEGLKAILWVCLLSTQGICSLPSCVKEDGGLKN